jgi:acetyl esterase/lipase
LKLDLCLPGQGEGPFPAVVCIHGGGWVGGDRKQMDQTIRTLAKRGYVAVSPDYRLAPRDRFPAQVEDCKAAVRWLRANARQYKIDPEHIGAIGFASGGHLACMLGVTDKGDGLEGTGGEADQSSRVQAVVSFFGPTDLAAADWGLDVTAKNLIPLLGGTVEQKAEAYRKASPLTYAGKNAAPLLIFHGSEDKMVPVDQSRKLVNKITEAGGAARLVVVQGEGHGFRPEKLLPCLTQMVVFFDGQLKP